MCVCVCVWLCASTIGTLNFSQIKEKTKTKKGRKKHTDSISKPLAFSSIPFEFCIDR